VGIARRDTRCYFETAMKSALFLMVSLIQA
jgi:hypothetical protein